MGSDCFTVATKVVSAIDQEVRILIVTPESRSDSYRQSLLGGTVGEGVS